MDLTTELALESILPQFWKSEMPYSRWGVAAHCLQTHRKGDSHREYQEQAFLPTWASDCCPERMDFNKCWLSLGLRLGGERG